MEKLSCTQKFVDFANVFKAFIGSTYLSMPFAFHQSGIIFGVILLLVVGWLTDYCCVQIVKCKAIIISRLMENFQEKLDNGSLPIREAELFRSGKLRSRWENRMTLGHIAKYAYGKKAQWIVTICLFVSQFGFCTGYFVFIGLTLKQLIYHEYKNGTNLTAVVEGVGYQVPISYLVMVPFPLFVLFSLLRTVRNIGWVSAIATGIVVFGFLSVLGLMLDGFTVNQHFSYVQFATLPMVFGLLTCGFEGIGTVIPIESSMVGNRHNFKPYLHVSMTLMVLILGSFGILGHLRYGPNTEQVVLQNIPYSIFVSVVNAVLIVGVLCTYPLQMFPVSEIAEFLIFRKTSSDLYKERSNMINQEYNSKDDEDEKFFAELSEDEIDYENTASNTHNPTRSCNINYGTDIPCDDSPAQLAKSDATINTTSESVFTKKEERMIRIIHGSKITAATWKRNCVRALLVLLQLGLAVAMRNNYAYLNAFIGAIGSSFLAYILPAATYYKLTKGSGQRCCNGYTDILIIIFGIVGTITSFVVTVIALVYP